MSAVHSAPFEGAGKTYKLHSGGSYRVEDYWDRVNGEPWGTSRWNPAALKYAMRIAFTDIPADDEVVYGKDEIGIGHLVHVSELAEVVS